MAKFKRKYTYIDYKNCINPSCDRVISIRTIGDTDSEDYGLPIPTDRRKLACSRECHKHWQTSISWEDRVGSEFAIAHRKKMSERLSANNPSTLPGVAEKISKGLKKYFAENPTARLGVNNPFYGRTHSEETIQHWKCNKTGRQSYNNDQKLKQAKNTPKKENHPNWRGGIANGEYGPEFNSSLKCQVKEYYSLTCQICNEVSSELDIHHIDYNKKNNKFENLIPLCKHCHGKTNYDRDHWQKMLTEIKNTYILKDK